VAQRLLEEGRRVVALRRDVDPASRFHSEGIEERCTLVLADLADHDALVRVLNEHDVTEVFHLAAQAIVGRANRSPLATWESNVRGTWCLLEACRTLGTMRKVVVASSDKAYGEHAELPYREDFALQPRYPYDVSKACTDMIARSYAATYSLPVAVTRLANVYGPGDLSWSRIVPDTARALARGQAPVIRSDGTPERDFLYVEDAVEAYLAIAASLDRSGFEGRAWNAGCGQPVAVIDVVRRLIEVSGRALEPDVRGTGTPHGEIDRQYLDSTAIRSELGWEPRWELRDGLAITWEWYRRHLSG
jgi:CDP-glucose 4,6-dehydratase